MRLARCGPMLRHCSSRNNPASTAAGHCAGRGSVQARTARATAENGEDGCSHGGKCNTSLHAIAVPPLHSQFWRPCAIGFAATLPGAAQSRAAVTVDDYTRAEKFLGYNTNPLVSNGAVQANWLPGDRFWYRNQGVNGPRILPRRRGARPRKAPAFNHAAVAAALTTAMGKPVTAARLPFTPDHVRRRRPVVLVRQRPEAMDLRRAGQAVHARPIGPAPCRTASCRPMASCAAYIRDHNLWVRDIATGTGQAADDRRHQGLRLRDRQRRLDQQRSPGAEVVAGLEANRHLPAGSAQDRRDVSGQHRCGTSDVEGLEVPAAW